MKMAASAALALSLTATLATAEDAAPEVWLSQATCADVMHRIDDPFDKTGLSSPVSGIVYLGTALGYIEGYRAAEIDAVTADQFKREVFKNCDAQPDTPFKAAVQAAAEDAV